MDLTSRSQAVELTSTIETVTIEAEPTWPVMGSGGSKEVSSTVRYR